MTRNKLTEALDAIDKGESPFVGNGSTDFIDTPGHQLVPGDWQSLENIFPPLDTPIEPRVARRERVKTAVGDALVDLAVNYYGAGAIPATDHDALEAELAAGVEAELADYDSTARVSRALRKLVVTEMNDRSVRGQPPLGKVESEVIEHLCAALARLISGGAA